MSDSLLDLELLRTFYYVVKLGELQKAAEKVFRSKAAVSMQLKKTRRAAWNNVNGAK